MTYFLSENSSFYSTTSSKLNTNFLLLFNFKPIVRESVKII